MLVLCMWHCAVHGFERERQSLAPHWGHLHKLGNDKLQPARLKKLLNHYCHSHQLRGAYVFMHVCVFMLHLICYVMDVLHDQWHFSCLQPKWFEAIMIAWPWNTLFKCLSFFSLPVHRFSVNVEPGTKLESGPASLHLCNNLLVLTRGLPPVVVGHWKLSALRRYGAVPNGFVFEGGTRCGYCKYLVDWEALIYLALQPAPRNETLWHYQVKNHHSQCRTTSRPLMLLFVMF